jgi:hypothetical protein
LMPDQMTCIAFSFIYPSSTPSWCFLTQYCYTVDSVSTVNFEALPLLSSNQTYSNSMIDWRGESETSKRCSAVELYFEHQKNIVNAKIDQRIFTNITSMG